MILRHTLSRRALLTGSAAAFITSRAWPLSAQPRNDPFALGVASGYPGPDRAVLWTRLAPEPLSPDPARPGRMPPPIVPVDWEVAIDPNMQQVTRRGRRWRRRFAARSASSRRARVPPARGGCRR